MIFVKIPFINFKIRGMDSIQQTSPPSQSPIDTGRRILGLHSEIIRKYGTPKSNGTGPTKLSKRLLKEYGLRPSTFDDKSNTFTHAEFWELVCRDPDIFNTSLKELLPSGRIECGVIDEVYSQCCCDVPCNDNFWVYDTQTRVTLEPIGSQCIKRFNIKAGEETAKIVTANKIRREIDTYGIEEAAIRKQRHICSKCESWLVDMSRTYGKTYKICNNCLVKKPHHILPRYISTKPLKNVDLQNWENQYQSQPLPWYISLYLDTDGELYIYNKNTSDTHYIESSYGIKLDYKSSEWIFKIKTETSEDTYKIINYGNVNIHCTLCNKLFASSAMHPSIEIFGKHIHTNHSMCHDCNLVSPMTIYKTMCINTPQMQESLSNLYNTNMKEYNRLEKLLTYAGEKCRQCKNLLVTSEVSTPESPNCGRLMKWCKECKKKTGSGFRGWLNDLTGLKEPHPNNLIYAKMFDTFKNFIRDKPYLLNQIELYNISKQHQKKICSVWYT